MGATQLAYASSGGELSESSLLQQGGHQSVPVKRKIEKTPRACLQAGSSLAENNEVHFWTENVSALWGSLLIDGSGWNYMKTETENSTSGRLVRVATRETNLASFH